MAKLSEVFIAGGQPTITYNPRKELGLEDKLIDYLETGFKILSMTGPTKSGKTVLVRSKLNLENSCWISGGQIGSLNDFWDNIIEKYEGFTNFTEILNEIESKGNDESIDGKINVGLANISGTTTSSQTHQTSFGSSRSRQISPKIVATKLLNNNQEIPLIIDDFHYIDQNLQMKIIRFLKDLIFNGLKVIIISVPHRAYDVVKVEREMTGRLTQLEISLWKEEELKYIMEKGFSELNVKVSTKMIHMFAKESFGSPHLTQDFCNKFCRMNEIIESNKKEVLELSDPKNMDAFFREIASDTSKTAFERLSIGPRQRTDRKERRFVDGSKGDIYKAILLAIAKTGPKTSLTYEQIRHALRDILADQVPQAYEITRVLDKMTEIARSDIVGEPVVDYDKDFSTLYISDPFFAYYLRWGTKIPS